MFVLVFCNFYRSITYVVCTFESIVSLCISGVDDVHACYVGVRDTGVCTARAG